MNNYSLLLLLLLLTACKEQAFVEVRLAPKNTSFSVAQALEAVEVLKARLSATGTDFEAVEYQERAQQFIVLLPTSENHEMVIRQLIEEVDIGFWLVSLLTDPAMLTFLNTLSPTERKSAALAQIRFNENEQRSYRPEVLAFTTKEAMVKKASAYLRTLLPEGMIPAWSANAVSEGPGIERQYELFILQASPEGKARIDHSHIKEAEFFINDDLLEPQLLIKFDGEGTERWRDMTEQASLEGNRNVAITKNGRVLFSPRVMSPILDGRSIITGAFSAQEADQMATTLNSGALPFPLTVISVTQPKE